VANYNEISLITLEPSVEREIQRNDTFCHKMNFLVENYVFWNINPRTGRTFVETADSVTAGSAGYTTGFVEIHEEEM